MTSACAVLVGALPACGMAQNAGPATPMLGQAAESAEVGLASLRQAARAARDERQPDLAERLYRQALRTSTRADDHAGLAMALAEQGRQADALGVLHAIERPGLAPADALEIARAHTYVLSLGPDLVQALAYVRTARERFPNDAELLASHLDVLLRLGAPFQAHDIATASPATPPRLRVRIDMDRAAHLLRWARQAPTQALARPLIDQALALNANADASAPGTDGLPSDRVQMLQQRGAAEHAVALGAQRADQDWPLHTRAALADAHLQLRQPERAVALYRSALAEAPALEESLEWRIGLGYALLEAGDFDACERELQALVKQVTAYRWSADGQQVAHPASTQVSVFDAMVHAYLEDTRFAGRRLEALADQAPFAFAIRQATGDLSLLRGWPRQASQIYQRLQVDEPTAPNPLLGQADAAMALGEYPTAGHLLDQLRASGEAELREARLRDRWAAEQRPYWVWDWQTGQESARAVPTSREWVSNARLYGAVNEQSRLFAQHVHQHTREAATERMSEHQALGLGMQWRGALGRAEAGLTHSPGPGARSGLFVALDWTPDDHWTLQTRLDTNSTDTPLKARRDGVHGRRAEASLHHRLDDLTRWSLHAGATDLSDGNRRLGLSAQWDQQWLRTPRHMLSTQVGVSSGLNREVAGASYFNPRSDRSVWLSGQHQWTPFLRYERRLMLRLNVSAGRYVQSGFAGGATWGTSLEGEWRWSPGSAVRLGLARDSRLYDGVAHQQTRVLMGWEWRL